MFLRQTLSKPIGGYWDGGPKQQFDWSIQGPRGYDSKGEFVRVGSWSANYWFNVIVGKTDKLTLSNARRKLLAGCKRSGIPCKFEYVEVS